MSLDLLLEEDKAFLLRKGWTVEVTKADNQEIYIIIRNFPLSSRYSPRQTDVLIRILPGYPDSPLDMFWTKPDVLLAENNQKPNQADSYETFFGEQWQRWSRHLNGWRGGIDCLESFYAAALHKELTS